MASRAEQKAAARARREAQIRAASQAQARRMRIIWLGGIVAAVALVIVIIAVAVGGNGKKSVGAKTAKAEVKALLHGIPESGNVLGNPKAKITITEFGDLVCPICQEFALGSEQNVITDWVRTGKAKLEYRALETASEDANSGEFVAGQVAARAAGTQDLEWYYIMLWYEQQKSEDDPYVNEAWLQHIAQQVPGLNLPNWQSARNDASLTAAVNADGKAASAAGYDSTPTILISGPKGNAQPLVGAYPYSDVKAVLQSVS